MTKGSAESLLLGTILIRASYRPSCTPRGRFRPPATEQSWVMVPGMYETHCKHCSLIAQLVFNNLALRCGYMCAGTLIHISRHLVKTSNKNSNKRYQLCIRCMLAEFAFIGFYIGLTVYDHYYVITAYILLYHLCSIPPVSCSYLIIP